MAPEAMVLPRARGFDGAWVKIASEEGAAFDLNTEPANTRQNEENSNSERRLPGLLT